MKISYRILFINFAIVTLILVSSAIGFYSIMYNVLSSQQSKHLRNSANVFLYAYRELLQETEDNLVYLLRNETGSLTAGNKLNSKEIDFIFEVRNADSSIINYTVKDIVNFPGRGFLNADKFNTDDFLDDNPYAVLKTLNENNSTIFYGRILTAQLLNSLAGKISADVAIIFNDVPTDISNYQFNQKYIHTLSKAYSNLKKANNFEINLQETEDADILSSIYKPSGGTEISKINFLIFSTLSEAADLQSSL